MNKFNNYYKTEKEAAELGFTKEQIKDAKMFGSHQEIDERCFNIFDIETLYYIDYDKIIKFYFINYKGQKFKIALSGFGNKQKYNISPTYNEMLGYGHDKVTLWNEFEQLAYNGNNVYKFNEKNLKEMLECTYKQQEWYLKAYEKSGEAKAKVRQLLTDNGYTLYGEDKAYKHSLDRNISVEIIYSENGSISQKVTAYSVDLKDAQERLYKLDQILK